MCNLHLFSESGHHITAIDNFLLCIKHQSFTFVFKVIPKIIQSATLVFCMSSAVLRKAFTNRKVLAFVFLLYFIYHQILKMHSIVGIIHKEEKKQSILQNIVSSHHSIVSGSPQKYFWPHIKFENDLVFEIIPRTENMYHIVYALTGHFKQVSS